MKRLTQDEWIKKAKEIHEDKYDYSKVVYKNIRTKVIIICKNCGVEFEQIAGRHIFNNAVCKCFHKHKKYNKESFIKAAQKIHGNEYDYSEIEYKNTHFKIKIKCNICKNIFWQLPSSHLSGHGCLNCVPNKNSINFCSNKEEFIKKAKLIHKEKYSYQDVNYKGSKVKIKIWCKKCKKFFSQTPNSHLSSRGCPFCSKKNITSKGEKEVLEYIKLIFKGKIIENDRNVLNGKELDIYLPDLKIGIEYNGDYWHQKHELASPGYHIHKQQLCHEKNIELINISENNWKTNNEEIKHFLKTKIKKL